MENEELREMKELLKENSATNRDIQRRLQKIESYLKWQKVWAVLKILIIAVPVVLSIIYLPPLFQEVFKEYRELLGPTGSLEF